MKRIFLTSLLFIMLLMTGSAQIFPIDTAKLNSSYRALLKEPQSYSKQMDFFKAFPANWNDFYCTYRFCEKEGYDLSMYDAAYEHIEALGECTAINDTLFCRRLIALSVGASLEADAPNYLHGLIRYRMEQKSDIFMYCLSQIEKGHQMQFWQFYWSSIVENGTDTKEFKALYRKYKRKYPDMMKRMAVAFENFNNGVLFMSIFCKGLESNSE